MRGTFQERLNTKLESLKFDIIEDGWRNFRKRFCEITDSVFGKKVKNITGNVSENALSLIERRKSTRII